MNTLLITVHNFPSCYSRVSFRLKGDDQVHYPSRIAKRQDKTALMNALIREIMDCDIPGLHSVHDVSVSFVSESVGPIQVSGGPVHQKIVLVVAGTEDVGIDEDSDLMVRVRKALDACVRSFFPSREVAVIFPLTDGEAPPDIETLQEDLSVN